MGDSDENIAPETDRKEPQSKNSGTNKSPSKSPQMDSKQMARVKSTLMTRKEKLLQAQEEERNFVEFRKKQILFDFRPKSQGTARKSDDSFPRKKRGVNMGFGEMKAALLGIRPDPKYATWFGKKTPQKEKKKLSLRTASSSPKKPQLEQSVDVKSVYVNPIDGAEDEPVERKGNRDGRPLDANGTPFWMNVKQEDDTDEDDSIVNVEVVERALKNELKLDDCGQRNGTFDYSASINLMKKWDKKFEKKIIFSNTIRTVVALAEERNATSKVFKLDPQSIKWADKMSKTSYNLSVAKTDWKTDSLPLMDVIKE